MRFKETAVGHYLYVYAPIEYTLLMDYCSIVKTLGKQTRIAYDVLETISLNSKDVVFKTVRFRKAMILYRRFKTRPPKKAEWTKRDVLHFAKHSYKIYKSIIKNIER